MARKPMTDQDRADFRAILGRYPPATIAAEIKRASAPKPDLGRPPEPLGDKFANRFALWMLVERKRPNPKASIDRASKFVADDLEKQFDSKWLLSPSTIGKRHREITRMLKTSGILAQVRASVRQLSGDPVFNRRGCRVFPRSK